MQLERLDFNPENPGDWVLDNLDWLKGWFWNIGTTRRRNGCQRFLVQYPIWIESGGELTSSDELSSIKAAGTEQMEREMLLALVLGMESKMTPPDRRVSYCMAGFKEQVGRMPRPDDTVKILYYQMPEVYTESRPHGLQYIICQCRLKVVKTR